jgi:predicted nucleic acid-binding protein
MPGQRIYVETTIPSAYYTSRSSPAMVERRDQTREWWSKAMRKYDLVSSPAVFLELARGTSAHVPARLALVLRLPLLEITPEAIRTAKMYVERKIMPANPFEDALHLALASHHECWALVTWNFRHLANDNKFNQIRRINTELGLRVPVITSPQHLAGESNEQT